MIRLILDCDNTMGIPGRPMDDALAYFYLLGRREQAQILGITATFGNGTVAEVVSCCHALPGLRNIPVFPGAEANASPISPAAQFIAEAAAACPGQISVLAVGSLSNLYGAFLLDSSLFSNLRAVVLMGGITEPLFIHGCPLPELNFSVNPIASAAVLLHARNLSVLTGNNCLSAAYLTKQDFLHRMWRRGTPASRVIAEKCGYRFEDKHRMYGAEGSYCWDVTAAVYLLKPELFSVHSTPCLITAEDTKLGFLHPVSDTADGNCMINLPVARDSQQFREEIYQGWLHADLDS